MEIELKNLIKKFNGEEVIHSINFKIKGPGIIGYIGPNGAGKTTTFKILANLMKADSGNALIDGIDSKEYKKTLKIASFLIDNPEPYDEMTIREFLKFIGEIRSINKEIIENRIDELSKSLHLDNLDKKCGILSKGNKQRVVIAATLLPDTDILVLDEPTSGLDPAETYDIKELFKQLGKKKLILFSSHIITEIAELCNDIIIIDKGKIIKHDSIDNIIKKFGDKENLEKAYINLIRGKYGN